MRRIFIFFLLLISFDHLSAQKINKKLQQKIEELIKGFHGDIGVYVKDLRKEKIVAINADTVFPTASIVKIPILIGIMDKINRKQLDYDQELLYRDSLAYSDYDVTASFKDTTKIL